MEHPNEDDFLDIEGPPVESTADVTDVAADDTDDTPSGQPRDERGRFATRDGDEDADDEAEPTDDAPAADPAPAADAPPASDAPPAEGAPAAAGAAAVATEPLTLKVGGREVALDLVRGEGGALTIPADQTQLYLDVLRDGLHHRTSFRQELAARDQQRTQEVQAVQTQLREEQLARTRAEKLAEELDALITERIGSPEAARRFAENYDYEMRLLVSQLQGVQQQVQAYQLPAPEPTVDPAAIITAVASQAAPLIQELGDLFDAEDISAIAAHLDVAAERYIVVADRDYPEHDVKKGERVVDLDAVRSYIQSVAAPKRRATAQIQTRAVEASRAADKNAASPAGRFTAAPPSAAPAAPASAPGARPAASAPTAASAPPPTIRSGAASPNAAPAPAGSPRSRREWEASLRVGGQSSADDDFYDG